MRHFNYFAFSNSNHMTVILGVVQVLMMTQDNCLYHNISQCQSTAKLFTYLHILL